MTDAGPDSKAVTDSVSESRTEAAIRQMHNRYCEFAGGGMCYRLECAFLDGLREVAHPATDTHNLPGHKAHECRICGEWTEAHPATEELDVERLQAAMKAAAAHKYKSRLLTGPLSAQRVADQYARLSSSEGQEK